MLVNKEFNKEVNKELKRLDAHNMQLKITIILQYNIILHYYTLKKIRKKNWKVSPLLNKYILCQLNKCIYLMQYKL